MNGFHQYDGLLGFEFLPSVKVEKVKVDRPNSKSKDILDMIYMADPNTGFPCGALSHYLSDSVRPEIKQFIEDNILRDIPQESYTDIVPEISKGFKDLSDDFKFDIMRGRYEDVESYKDRITQSLKEMSDSERSKRYAESIFKKFKSLKKDVEEK